MKQNPRFGQLHFILGTAAFSCEWWVQEVNEGCSEYCLVSEHHYFNSRSTLSSVHCTTLLLHSLTLPSNQNPLLSNSTLYMHSCPHSSYLTATLTVTPVSLSNWTGSVPVPWLFARQFQLRKSGAGRRSRRRMTKARSKAASGSVSWRSSWTGPGTATQTACRKSYTTWSPRASALALGHFMDWWCRTPSTAMKKPRYDNFSMTTQNAVSI